MKEQRFSVVHSGQERAAERTAAWAALRDVVIGRAAARPASEEEMAIDAATSELRRAEPSLASWTAPDRAGAEPPSPKALWTLAVVIWGATLSLIVGLIGVVAYLVRG